MKARRHPDTIGPGTVEHHREAAEAVADNLLAASRRGSGAPRPITRRAVKHANAVRRKIGKLYWVGDPSIQAPAAVVPERAPVSFGEPAKPPHLRRRIDSEDE